MVGRTDADSESTGRGPLCLNEASSPSRTSAEVDVATIGKTGRSRTRTSSDPRVGPQLSVRDVAVLRFLAVAREAAQYQVRALLFAGLSEVVVSRCIQRLLGWDYIAIDRWRKVGINRLRLTRKGSDYLVDNHLAVEADIHVAERPAAEKDVAHGLWITDVLVLFQLFAPEVDALPCWKLRRKVGAAKGVSIPDLLAVPRSEKTSLVAVEIDRATERMKVVQEKLVALDSYLSTLASGPAPVILFLTIGPRRVMAIQKTIETVTFRSTIHVAELPREAGRPGLQAMAQLVFKRDVYPRS